MRSLHIRPLSHRAALLLALFVTVLWSSSWILIRWGLDDEGLPPATFAALRYGIAAIVLVVWVIFREARHRHVYRVDRRFVFRLVALGVLMYTLTQGAVFVALDQQPAATTSLVLAMTPLFVAVGAALALAEAPTPWQIVGVLLVGFGAWAYFAGDLGATAAGLIAAVVALGANVASTILGRSVNRSGRLPAVTVTAVSMAIGAGALAFIAFGAEGVPVVTERGWLIIGWLAIVNTALAFTLWNVSMQSLTAVESASINNTMLVQIALLAWLFLGEAPGPLGLLGIAAVSTGVYLVQSRRGPSSGVRTTEGPGEVEPGRLPD